MGSMITLRKRSSSTQLTSSATRVRKPFTLREDLVQLDQIKANNGFIGNIRETNDTDKSKMQIKLDIPLKVEKKFLTLDYEDDESKLILS